MSDLRVRVEGRVGRLTLQRPRALNALTHDMALAFEAALLDWRDDPAIALVLVDAVGEKAFCAGGDVAALYRQGVAGDVESGRRFWRDEYRLNMLIAGYPKPIVALMDGIVMGGGIGLSAHASHRVVTERSSLALPECAIGLVPDVGSTHLLARAPGHLGEYLGLSGERFAADDARHAGFADHRVPSGRLDDLRQALIESADVDVIARFEETPRHAAPAALADRAEHIDTIFGAETLPEVLARLDGTDAPWASGLAERIARGSPLSLCMTFALIRAARAAPGIEAALAREYRFVSRVMELGDFLEGVRAALIERDGRPVWRHASLAEVAPELIARFSEVAPGGDVRLG